MLSVGVENDRRKAVARSPPPHYWELCITRVTLCTALLLNLAIDLRSVPTNGTLVDTVHLGFVIDQIEG